MYTIIVMVALLAAFADAKGVFYAFTANGIDIIDPKNLKIVQTISSNTKIPGTTETICTRSRRSGTACGFGGAVAVGEKYVFVADPYGNRVIVIDSQRHVPIKAIPTHGFPYQLRYFAALDEVWIMCWKNSFLDVVGEKQINTVPETSIQKISNASSLTVVHSIKAQAADSYKYIMHGYLEAENCQNVDPKLHYGVVTHFNEPGIHKIDLINKRYEKFINTTAYGCKSTFGLAYSSMTKYAFVQCLGYLRGNKKRKMIVVDLLNDTVIHADDAITDQATGYLYSSPDGKYVVVINADKIISYYLESRSMPIQRLGDVSIQRFRPSRAAFIKDGNGYKAYITWKAEEKILVINYNGNKITSKGVIHGVGKGTDLSPHTLPKYAMAYLSSCKLLLQKLNQPFTNVNFIKCAMKMYLQHVTRRISTGCDVSDRYIATPADFDNKVAIIDGKKQKLVGMVTLVSGVPKKKTDLLWVPL